MNNLEKVKKLIESVEWRFAKSMPEIPHEYIVIDNYPEKTEEIQNFINEIEKNDSARITTINSKD